MMPLLRHLPGDKAWWLAIGLMWIPAIIVVLTVEDWLHVPQGIQWISLGVLFVVFIVVSIFSNRQRR